MARDKAAGWLLALGVAASAACADHMPLGLAAGDAGNSALDAASAVASLEPTLYDGLRPNEEGWRQEGGFLTSPGWRAASVGRFDALGARMTRRADGLFEVGVSQIERLRLGIHLEGASSVAATIDGGRLVFAEAWPNADAIVTTTPTRFEVLVLLRDAGAPSNFTWRVDLPRGISGTRPDGFGGLFFADATGVAALHVDRPFAVDSAGARRDADLAWENGELSIRLSTMGLSFPILIDPAIESAFWEQKQPAMSPSGRAELGMAYDSVRNVTVLFGGLETMGSMTVDVGDTWEWDGDNWSPKCTASPCDATGMLPAPVADQGMTFDAAHGDVVMFGGSASGAPSADTWEWDGTKWTEGCSTCMTLPAPRQYAALSYSGALADTVLFGGYTYLAANCTGCFDATPSGLCPAPSADTWAWSGTAWTEQLPANAPAARYASAMVYDSQARVNVLFGGFENSTTLANDTWAWDGTNWTELCVAAPCNATLPAARLNHGMAFDSIRHKTVLFGGTSSPIGATSLGDTWEWDGDAWTPTIDGLAPSARQAAGMVFDEKRGVTVLFGGAASGYLADTWEYHAHGGACTADSQCDTQHCVDGVCCESVCGTCSRCDQVASLTPGPPPAGPVASPGICSPVTNAQDPGSCAGNMTCDVEGACKGGPGYPCKAPSDCASGSCPNGCCDGVACTSPDGGPSARDAGKSGEPSGGGGGCGCRFARSTGGGGSFGGALVLVLGVFVRRRSSRRALVVSAALGGAALATACSLITPLGDLSADFKADAGDAGDAGADSAHDASHEADAHDAGRPMPPSHPAVWSESFGSSADQYVYAVTVDSTGDILIAGGFTGALDFGDGGVLAASGSLHAFVAMLDPAGNGIWGRSFGGDPEAGSSQQEAFGVAVDTLGDVLVVGSFEGSIVFDSVPFLGQGGQDIFVVKLDTTGAFQWATTAGGPGDQVAWGAALDAKGNVYVSGAFEGSITIGSGTYPSTGGFDALTFALPSNGSSVDWVSVLGGPKDQMATGVAMQPGGDPYVTGYFEGPTTFDGDAAGPPTADAGYRAFVYGVTPSSGTPSPALGIGGSANAYGYSVAVGLGGDVAVAGPFQGTISSFPGHTLVSAGLDDVFVGELSAGSVLWGQSFGDPEDQIAYGVAIDGEGNVVVTGSLQGTGNVGSSLMRSAGGNDVFVAKYGPDGTPMWGERFGDPMDQEGTAIATTAAATDAGVDGGTSDIVVVGNFLGTINFGNETLTSRGGSDIFVAKIPP
jgi:hypothetical protein